MPTPPVAAAVLLSGAGAMPAHTVWLAPMAPGATAGATVMATVAEFTQPVALVTVRV